MGASFKRARAIEMRCLSPPDNLAPFSPIGVANPCGKRFTNSSQLAALAATRTY